MIINFSSIIKQHMFAYVTHARTNERKVSCSMKQREPLMELELTTDATHCAMPPLMIRCIYGRCDAPGPLFVLGFTEPQHTRCKWIQLEFRYINGGRQTSHCLDSSSRAVLLKQFHCVLVCVYYIFLYRMTLSFRLDRAQFVLYLDTLCAHV